MKNKIVCLAVILFSMLVAAHSTRADVNVFAEGAYTDNDLVVYIYADTTIESPSTLRSAGVKLTYIASQLQVTGADKNEDLWSLGGEEYMNPETSTPGEVVIILGKLDPDDTFAGVSGERVLLGKVTFAHAGLTSFALSLDYGKRGTTNEFKNFVDTATPDANVLDDTAVNFGTIIVAERGDANASGTITMADVMLVKHMYLSQSPYVCYADANASGAITMADVMLVKHMYQTGN